MLPESFIEQQKDCVTSGHLGRELTADGGLGNVYALLFSAARPKEPWPGAQVREYCAPAATAPLKYADSGTFRSVGRILGAICRRW